jgi:signal transduction histidine kinase
MTAPGPTRGGVAGGYRQSVPNLIARGLGRRSLITIDAVLAVGLVVLVLLAVSDYGATLFFTGPDEFGLVVGLALGLPVAVRRIWPLGALAGVFVSLGIATVTGMAWGESSVAFMLPLALVLYPVALQEPTRRAVVALVVSVVSTSAAILITARPYPAPVSEGPGGPEWPGLIVFDWLLLTAVWGFGRAMRARRAYAASTSAQLAQQAVTDERMRIARELHDIVAHSLSLITVKASIANHVATERPEEAQDALRIIADTSRSTLTEMRRLLGVLRSEGDPALAPAPGLSGLDELASRAGLAGVQVDLTVHGTGSLPEGVELSIYRIVQEALTNVVKHAAPARCRVVVDTDEHEARVSVVDDGPGVRTLPSTSQGHGLIGMRERVMMFDGEFTAGPRVEGGFAVTALLPYQASGERP